MIKFKNFIKIEITPDMVTKVEEIAKSSNVWMPYNRLVDGFIEEQLFASLFSDPVRSEGVDVCHYGYVIDGKRWEVKSKTRPSDPRTYYEGSVYDYHPAQKSDYLAFVQVSSDRSCGWVIGYMERREFDELKQFIPRGSKQGNGLVCKTDTWNIEYKQCKPMKEVL